MSHFKPLIAIWSLLQPFGASWSHLEPHLETFTWKPLYYLPFFKSNVVFTGSPVTSEDFTTTCDITRLQYIKDPPPHNLTYYCIQTKVPSLLALDKLFEPSQSFSLHGLLWPVLRVISCGYLSVCEFLSWDMEQSIVLSWATACLWWQTSALLRFIFSNSSCQV